LSSSKKPFDFHQARLQPTGDAEMGIKSYGQILHHRKPYDAVLAKEMPSCPL
jgi:hypothetical protein